MLKEYNKEDPEPEVETLLNSGVLELAFDHREKARTEFLEAAKIMVNSLPPEAWTFEIFYFLENLATLNKDAEID